MTGLEPCGSSKCIWGAYPDVMASGPCKCLTTPRTGPEQMVFIRGLGERIKARTERLASNHAVDTSLRDQLLQAQRKLHALEAEFNSRTRELQEARAVVDSVDIHFRRATCLACGHFEYRGAFEECPKCQDKVRAPWHYPTPTTDLCPCPHCVDRRLRVS